MMLDSEPTRLTLEGPEAHPERWPRVGPESPEDRSIYPGEGLEFVQGKKRNWWAKP
jgi:hypothetical protein